MENNSAVHIGVVGTNFISDWFAEAVSHTDGVEITAVYSRAYETGVAFAEKHGIKSVFTDYREMLGSLIDAVYIASPIFMHYPQTLEAIKHGKHVLCEKMMAASYPLANDIANEAKRRGVVLLEAMRPAFDPSTEMIADLLASIGTPRRARLIYCQYSSRYDRFMRGELPNAFNPAIANSALSDIGIYPLHMAMFLFGEPIALESKSSFLRGGFEADGKITLTYPDMTCEVVYSKIRDSSERSFIEGDEGRVEFDRINMPTLMTHTDKCGNTREIPVMRAGSNMVYEIEAFRDIVLGKRSYIPYLNTTLSTVKAVSLAYSKSGADKYIPREYLEI